MAARLPPASLLATPSWLVLVDPVAVPLPVWGPGTTGTELPDAPVLQTTLVLASHMFFWGARPKVSRRTRPHQMVLKTTSQNKGSELLR